jgi:hypothetical protein
VAAAGAIGTTRPAPRPRRMLTRTREETPPASPRVPSTRQLDRCRCRTPCCNLGSTRLSGRLGCRRWRTWRNGRTARQLQRFLEVKAAHLSMLPLDASVRVTVSGGLQRRVGSCASSKTEPAVAPSLGVNVRGCRGHGAPLTECACSGVGAHRGSPQPLTDFCNQAKTELNGGDVIHWSMSASHVKPLFSKPPHKPPT